ncbi:alpha/beta fold hydrolase [Gordonia aquimaris]|jgi:pimeloyl-ACP methyl ester carboxylesterase|uniref:Alpha/beta hydrolase n=1 Tax=Gordonia aquimaris TaxID=2984863 RepID=A0A9X3D260_9ACTN|nr:alpha/beta hydrolase [Gordonia aquimaris]MCX2963310.1 alpha/beta hydrolase [Gordonia aquimaris]
MTEKSTTRRSARRAIAIAAGAGAAVGVGVLAAGVGTIFAGMLREAFRAQRAVDDGPDDLLSVPQQPPRRITVESSGGVRLNVERYGPADADGDVVVMVHGWTCNTAYWYPQINHLAGDRPVIAYDQRGHGASELGRVRPTIAMLGQDLNRVIEATVPNGRRAILVGHSMGGMTIMSWAAQYADQVSSRVSSVVLTSTAAKAVMQNHMLIPVGLPRYTKPFESTVGRLVTSSPIPVPHTDRAAWLSHYIALGPQARKAHVDFVDAMIMACPPRSRAGWGSAMGKLDVTAGLDALRVPTTVVVGTEDRLTPPVHAEEMAEVLRRNGVLRELVSLEGVGHMSSIEASVRYNELLDEVLAEVTRPEPAGSTARS